MSDEVNDEGVKPEPMDNLTKALALANLGIKVFPVHASSRAPAIPEKEGGRGFYDATSDDFELIATWFSLDYVGDKYAVGVWAGGSGLLTADIDKKNGKDGFARLEEHSLSLGDTFSYPTATNGEHHIFQTDRDDLTLGRDVVVDGAKLEGVDIRAGGSYFVWWGDTVPASRAAFSTDIPEWITEASKPAPSSTAEGFEGNVAEWLEHVPGGDEPSARVRDFMNRIPTTDFGHPEMVDLVWGIVRMGSERESGIRVALEKLREEWLRDPYDTPKNRKDFYAALLGAINKGGRVQNPVPAPEPFDRARAAAEEAGAWRSVTRVEREVSETISRAAKAEFGEGPTVSLEAELARARRELFKIAAKAGLRPSTALGIVTHSKAFTRSVVTLESAWYGDGEPDYHDYAEEEPDEKPEAEPEEEREKAKVNEMASIAESFSFLTDAERELLATDPAYRWFGDEYLDWVKTELKHFNRPYHVGSLWAALSVITSPWGVVPKAGARPMDCNLYINVQGMSTSGKSEAWGFGVELIDAYYGIAESPIIADAKKATALSIHRALILRDGKPSLMYSDEVQGFFKDIKKTHWQGSILSDMSDYYGGNVPPKHTMNDKEISGKRAKTKLTTYFTGIARQTLDAIDLDMWTDGLFYRFIWSFGFPRVGGPQEVKLNTSTPPGGVSKFEEWAKELRRVGALQEVRWGEGRKVGWEDDAIERFNKFSADMDKAVQSERLYDDVLVAANGRFFDSMMKVATIVALVEASETVTLRHVLIALSYAGPWHKSMVLAVSETGKDPFQREVERCLEFIKRNAIRQMGKRAYIQESTIMRQFFPNEIAERILRQLTKEGWIVKNGDAYELVTEE